MVASSLASAFLGKRLGQKRLRATNIVAVAIVASSLATALLEAP